MAKGIINIVYNGQKRSFGGIHHFNWWVDLQERFLKSKDMKNHKAKDRLVHELNRVKANVYFGGENGKS
ncbi:hypothetical protein [Wohlfahrtiimonas populi]|uniref:hypothetical protein n=1 Tax=Wohlfahrtiimonas populi TaxID=1940240 RepID=UPI00098D1584|nr:hypothetical protein [Wohlfahrtiimonas populi]